MVENIIHGFNVALSVSNIFFCFIGILLGTIVGILPGIGTMTTLSMLLPFTYLMNDPISAIIMMSGIYYGSQYGGSISAILYKIPGEVSSVISCNDGYAMTKRGYAGAALGAAAMGSFIGGCFAALLVAGLSPLMIKFALLFGPREYFALIIFGIICSVLLGKQNWIKGFSMAFLGILLSMPGMDQVSGKSRFIFDNLNFANGISFVIICMGLYGISEIFYKILNDEKNRLSSIPQFKIFSKNSLSMIFSSWASMIRGCAVGSLGGMIPGGGTILSSVVSYAVEKSVAKDKESFGKGNIKGLVGPETANNAGAQTSFIPMLTLGIPVNPVLALIMATLIIHNFEPGPAMIDKNPRLFWGLVASMLIGNFFLLIINLTTVNFLVKILKIPFYLTATLVLLICVFAAYNLNNSIHDLFFLLIFGVFGYYLKKWNFDSTPLLIGFILGPKLEETFIQSMQLNHGNLFLLFETNFCIFLYSTCLILLFFIKFNKNNTN